MDDPAAEVFLCRFLCIARRRRGSFRRRLSQGSGHVITNTIKILGCGLMFFYDYVTPAGVPEYVTVLVAYGIVGLGAAAYSPAKYGILTELLPAERLVGANRWVG